MAKKSEINLTVELDENNVPEKIEWEATDADFEGKKECRSLMLSLWDEKDEVTLGIDLWTKKMLVEDMNIHFFQIFKKMSDAYLRATNNNEVAQMIEKFSGEFAEKLDLFKSVNKPEKE